MAIERTYNVPLRDGFRNTAEYKKTKKAVTTLKEFLKQHMKSDKILIGKHLNEELWKHGIKNPPHHVKITALKEDDGTIKAELIGFKFEHKKKEQKEDKKSKSAAKDTKDISEEVEFELKKEKTDKKAEKKETAKKEEKTEAAETVDKPKKSSKKE